jgi:integrase
MVDFSRGQLHVDRLKEGRPSVHPLGGTEIRALRRLQRESEPGRYVFITERGGPVTREWFKKMIMRTGEAAKLSFSVHPHMLRHSCGFKLANDGVDTRASSMQGAIHRAKPEAVRDVLEGLRRHAVSGSAPPPRRHPPPTPDANLATRPGQFAVAKTLGPQRGP